MAGAWEKVAVGADVVGTLKSGASASRQVAALTGASVDRPSGGRSMACRTRPVPRLRTRTPVAFAWRAHRHCGAVSRVGRNRFAVLVA